MMSESHIYNILELAHRSAMEAASAIQDQLKFEPKVDVNVPDGDYALRLLRSTLALVEAAQKYRGFMS